MGERPRSQARQSVFIGGTHVFDSGKKTKQNGAMRWTIGADKSNANQAMTSREQGLIDGYDSSTPTPANRKGGKGIEVGNGRS
jgi:hypothetical protein